MRARLIERPKLLYGGAIAIAVIGAVALILASVATHRRKSGAQPAGASVLASRPFADVPQHGVVLGSPTAPVTLVEYADLQCPFCGVWARDELPSIVDQLVRTGRVRLQFHGLAFVGQDSVTALAGALAAGRQNRLWDFVEAMYRTQGDENSGWVAESLESAAETARLAEASWNADRTSALVLGQIDDLAAEAAADGVSATPSFAVGRTGETPQLLPTHVLNVATLRGLANRLAE